MQTMKADNAGVDDGHDQPGRAAQGEAADNKTNG